MLDGTITPIHVLKLSHLLGAEQCVAPSWLKLGANDDTGKWDEEEDTVDPEEFDIFAKGSGKVHGDETQDAFSEPRGASIEVFVAPNDHGIESLTESQTVHALLREREITTHLAKHGRELGALFGWILSVQLIEHRFEGFPALFVQGFERLPIHELKSMLGRVANPPAHAEKAIDALASGLAGECGHMVGKFFPTSV